MAARNAGMNVVEDVTTVERKEEIKKIGKLVDELGGTATQVPKKVIKKIGKLVPDENAESNKKTASGTKVQDSGERDALRKKEYSEASVNSEIIELINKIKSKDFKQNDKVILQKLSSDVANEIKKLTGIDVSTFNVVIEARQLEHILKEHGLNGRTNESLKDYDDIAKMEYAMQSPDDLSLSGKTQAYSYMKNGYNRTADTVLYEKNIGDESYYVVQAIPDTKAKTLYIVSAFKGQKGYKKGASQLINAPMSPNATSQAGSVVVPNNRISNPDEKINPSDKNSSNSRAALEILPLQCLVAKMI